MHIILRNSAEDYLTREQLLVPYLLAVRCLEKHIDLVPSVITVADNRMSQMSELCSDLMSPSGNELKLKIRYTLTVRSLILECLK